MLATHGFEQSELVEPIRGLQRAGAEVAVVAPERGQIRGWDETDWGDPVNVDQSIAESDPSAFDALLLPGGVMNPDTLRMHGGAREFAKVFFGAGKPVSAICHGPQLLIECGVLSGLEMTSYPSLKTDLENAGARWVDREVVTDGGLTTSRSPKDLEPFIAKTIEEIGAGRRGGRETV